MAKALVGLLPLGVGLVVFAAIVWFLLTRNVGLGSWLLAAFLVGHGLVHVMFLMPQSAAAPATAGGVEYPFDMARSWLVTGAGLDLGLVRAVGGALIVVGILGFVLAGAATIGFVVPSGWWPVLVGGSTAVSVALLAMFFSPGLVLGFAIDAVLLWLVLSSSWSPGTALAAG